MVRPSWTSAAGRLCAAALAACLLALSLSSSAPAQGLEENYLTIEENYTVELTPTGDARVTDVLKYETDYFDEYAAVFEEYPSLLSRRYRRDTDVGEIEQFDVDVNERKATVTITFDAPGYAYNMGDTWDVYGFAYEPSKTRDAEMVFEGEGTLNNEFTLFEEAALYVTTTIRFPEGAADARYDAGDSAVKYVLPYKAGKPGSFLQNNRSVWIPVCAVLMVLSLLLLLYVIVNGRRTAAVPSSAAATPPVPVPPPAPAPQAAASPRFCKHCGMPARDPQKRFCSGCGKPLD